ncbi:MAG: alpha/beta hydrolase [Pirellulales bacterium]|nr:alpha/beta hydrolase [Pirellulales bacterium]
MMRRLTLLWLAALMFVWTASAAAQDAATAEKPTRIKPKSASFDSDGVKIQYITAGEGEPVILIHGFTASAMLNWQQSGVFDALARHYRVIALDNRGHGRSGKPHEPAKYGLEMVEDIVRLMDHLGIDRAHLVGYSMGGFITGKLVTTYPERVLTATLGGAGWTKKDDERMKLINELATSLEEGKGIGPLIRHLTPPGDPQPTEEQIAGMNQMILILNDPLALAAVARGMGDLEVAEQSLRDNKVPLLALIGDRDPLKDGVDRMEPVTANLKVVVLEGADHMSAFSQPEFIESLEAFLAEHSEANQPEVTAAGK